MVSELRHIIFRPFEVVDAYREFCRRSGTPLPAGTVVGCGPEADGAGAPLRFRIVIAPDAADGKAGAEAGDAPRREVVVDSATLAAALILYCRDRRIPLPASADKSLQRFGDQVCLLATINPRQDKATAALRRL